MLIKFKITNYVILLLIGLFLFPPSIKALDRIEQAEDRFGCSEGMSANEVRHCMETVISTKDAKIDQLRTKLSNAGAEQDQKTAETVAELIQ
jgi:hypothetical protein